VHYTREVGPSGDDYTGLLSIPAGLTLAVLAALTLWRSRKTDDAPWWRYTRRALYVGAAFVVAQVVLMPTALSYVITHAARPYVPEADLGAPYEDVEFGTSDGFRLKGWYIRSQNGAAVISFPGRASSQTRAKMLARHGYGVLVFDRRGEGESEGDPNLFGWQGERDIHAAVAFLQRQPDVDPERIGGIGLSVGGEMMIEAAAESDELKAIVSEGGSGRSVRDIVANPDMKWPELLGTGVVTAATALFTDNLPPADLKSLVPKISGATFFVYGEKGQSVEKPANEGFYAAARGPKEIWEVPGSGHMKGIEAQPQEYERRVVGFFDRALLGESAG
jgi:dienelactone hydrolase